MNWKAIYHNGTEIREGDTLVGVTREVLHDGVPTGRTEPQPASPVLLDQSQLAQFIIYGDKGTPVIVLSFPYGNSEKLLFTKRISKELFTDTVRGECMLVGKIHADGFTQMSQVFGDGTVIDGITPDIDFTSQLQLT